jgi:hypothetical protein
MTDYRNMQTADAHNCNFGKFEELVEFHTQIIFNTDFKD